MRLIRIATTRGIDTFVNPNQVVAVCPIEVPGTGVARQATRIYTMDNEWIDSSENIDTVCGRLTMDVYETKEK